MPLKAWSWLGTDPRTANSTYARFLPKNAYIVSRGCDTQTPSSPSTGTCKRAAAQGEKKITVVAVGCWFLGLGGHHWCKLQGMLAAAVFSSGILCSSRVQHLRMRKKKEAFLYACSIRTTRPSQHSTGTRNNPELGRKQRKGSLDECSRRTVVTGSSVVVAWMCDDVFSSTIGACFTLVAGLGVSVHGHVVHVITTED